MSLGPGTSSQTLRRYRYAVFGAWLATFLLFPFEEIAAFPCDYFQPTGVWNFVSEDIRRQVTNVGVLRGWRVVLIALGALCLWRAAMLVTVPFLILVLLQQSWIRGYGHVNHEEMGLLLATVVLVASGTGRTEKESLATVVTFNLVVCCSYTLVAASRLSQGVAFFLGPTLPMAIIENSRHPWLIEFTLGHLVRPTNWAGHLASITFPVITVVELLAPIALVSTRFRRVFIVAMIGFHISALLCMRLPFFENMVLLGCLWMYREPVKESGED